VPLAAILYNAGTMGRENQPKSDLERDLVVAYANTFIPRLDQYPLQLKDGSYTHIKGELYPDLIAAHLKGFITIGAYALDPQHQAKWLCFDADDGLRWDGLVALSHSLAERDIPTYLEPSRRGGHLWLFPETPLPGTDMRRLGMQLLVDHKLPHKKGKLPGIEIYPKQTELKTGPGSFVRLPLGKHRLTGHRYHFVTVTGEPLAPTVREQIRLLTTPNRVPQAYVTEILKRAPEIRSYSPTFPFQPSESPTQKYRRKKGSKRTTDARLPSEKIKSAVSVADFVRQYVELDADGTGYCPFHDDQKRSFSVNQERNFWYCFACEQGNTVIDFWMLWREKRGEDGSFTTTITELAQMLLK
jgi:hypothetical protein